MDNISLDYFLQQGFAIAVAIYLLYERSNLNTKTVTSLKEICLILKDLKEDIKEMKQK